MKLDNFLTELTTLRSNITIGRMLKTTQITTMQNAYTKERAVFSLTFLKTPVLPHTQSMSLSSMQMAV